MSVWETVTPALIGLAGVLVGGIGQWLAQREAMSRAAVERGWRDLQDKADRTNVLFVDFKQRYVRYMAERAHGDPIDPDSVASMMGALSSAFSQASLLVPNEFVKPLGDIRDAATDVLMKYPDGASVDRDSALACVNDVEELTDQLTALLRTMLGTSNDAPVAPQRRRKRIAAALRRRREGALS
jgi:hypothetical protein